MACNENSLFLSLSQQDVFINELPFVKRYSLFASDASDLPSSLIAYRPLPDLDKQCHGETLTRIIVSSSGIHDVITICCVIVIIAQDIIVRYMDIFQLCGDWIMSCFDVSTVHNCIVNIQFL